MRFGALALEKTAFFARKKFFAIRPAIEKIFSLEL